MAALDQQLFEEYGETLNFESYTYLDGEKDARESTKQDFLEGKVENPQLDYPHLNQNHLNSKLGLLTEGVHLVQAMSVNPVQELYRQKFWEKIYETQMLLATAAADDQCFDDLSRQAFGSPQAEIFTVYLQHACDKAHVADRSGNDEEKKAAQHFFSLFPSPEPYFLKEVMGPSEAVQAYAYAELVEPHAEFLERLKREEEADASAIADAFTLGLEYFGVKGWKVEMVANRTALSVSIEEQIIKVPETRVLTPKKFPGLIMHELMHTVRSYRGSTSALRLLSLGLASYLPGEEGLTTCLEQVVVRNFDGYKGFDGYFAIGLAKGLQSEHPRSFREVFSILQAYYALEKAKKNTFAEALELSKTPAWNRTVRTFRGTTCQSPGMVYTKDLAYAGNINIWNWIAENFEQGLHLPDVWSGKYNPVHKDTVDLMSAIDLL